MKKCLSVFLIFLASSGFAKDSAPSTNASLVINDKNYFSTAGLDVTVFSDIYPDGHQTGVTLIQHGTRVAANGDLRLEVSPGQWSPVPAGGAQHVDREKNRITQTMSYPDPTKNRTGFNPINYPDLHFSYQVSVIALGGNAFKISVDLDKPLPAEWNGKIGFNLELFPGDLFGKAFLMDQNSGIFPRQANGPIEKVADEFLAVPLAVGKKLIVAPEEDKQKITIENTSGNIELWDGRANHNNGWFIVRSKIPAGATKNAVEWTVTPNVIKGWQYKPVIQVSQLGYLPEQSKKVIIEQDARDTRADDISLFKLTEQGKVLVKKEKVSPWGKFLRYQYMTYDFSSIQQSGLYQVSYRDQVSQPFKIAGDIFARHAWQPTLEYFLPVQMCHMHVNEKYRVWHGLDYKDDALMAPINLNHFDGYEQGSSTLTKYKSGEHVPGLDRGGWHDAGDYDLRVESQIGTVWLLAEMVEEFNLNYDATTIDQEKRVVEIHQPDGKNDALQQIEHGLLSILGGYKSMGRLYRGIQDAHLKQYVLLGDASVQTDNVIFDKSLKDGEINNGKSNVFDDRWVFTEDNPDREVYVAGGLAAASRVLKDYNPTMAKDALYAAQDVFAKADVRVKKVDVKVFALAELYLATRDRKYLDGIVQLQSKIVDDIAESCWAIGRVMAYIEDAQFKNVIDAAVKNYQAQVRERARTESPYGVPYKPNIWGAGWTIQEFGVKQYFFRKSWPQLTATDSVENALNFVLGVHPGENNASFASGVGAKSATVAYGANRADWSYIPGGVISGTALIRPDLPELKVWPYFWQQTEYVMGGGETNYMFLVLAVNAQQKVH